jgi:hypothetical protein
MKLKYIPTIMAVLASAAFASCRVDERAEPEEGAQTGQLEEREQIATGPEEVEEDDDRYQGSTGGAVGETSTGAASGESQVMEPGEGAQDTQGSPDTDTQDTQGTQDTEETMPPTESPSEPETTTPPGGQ